MARLQMRTLTGTFKDSRVEASNVGIERERERRIIFGWTPYVDEDATHAVETVCRKFTLGTERIGERHV
jgi:hypothetical protein